jgi:Rhodopirellula transposase DDE domain
MSDIDTVKQKYELLRAAMDERLNRLWAASEAITIGRGGVTLVAEATGLSRVTIRAGIQELEALGLVPAIRVTPRRAVSRPIRVRWGDRIRRPGGGRKLSEVKDPAIVPTLEKLLTNEVGGDPASDKKWVRCSLRQLCEWLKEEGHPASPTVVGRLLKNMGYSLRANERKQGQSRANHPERDEQFRYIASRRDSFSSAGLPIISVDTKKKELIGNFRRPGKTWCKKPPEVNEHDYSSQAECLAVPFGIYDVMKNTGYVVVGLSHNTSEFAVSSISRWWQDEGQEVYPGVAELMILADGGGGNGCRSKAWRWNLQEKICNRYRLTVTVCHYPPGCSKWNPVEHRLFSQISNNWAGTPLRSLAIMLGYIRGTTTSTGLSVKAVLDEGIYPRGQKVTWKDVDALNLTPHEVCPEWNYTIRPSE